MTQRVATYSARTCRRRTLRQCIPALCMFSYLSKMRQKEYLLAKISFNTAENEPSDPAQVILDPAQAI